MLVQTSCVIHANVQSRSARPTSAPRTAKMRWRGPDTRLDKDMFAELKSYVGRTPKQRKNLDHFARLVGRASLLLESGTLRNVWINRFRASESALHPTQSSSSILKYCERGTPTSAMPRASTWSTLARRPEDFTQDVDIAQYVSFNDQRSKSEIIDYFRLARGHLLVSIFNELEN